MNILVCMGVWAYVYVCANWIDQFNWAKSSVCKSATVGRILKYFP